MVRKKETKEQFEKVVEKEVPQKDKNKDTESDVHESDIHNSDINNPDILDSGIHNPDIYNRRKNGNIDVIIALGIFAVSIIASMIFDFTLIIPMAVGFVCFAAAAVYRGSSLGKVMSMASKGFKDALIVASVILMIGLVTGTWRSSGTIALFVNMGIEMISPKIFILLAFVLCCIFSYAMGTSFGVVGTLGIILVSLAKAGDVSIAVTAGAVMSGAYFGDRFSPVSSSMLLTAAVTGTKPEKNLPLMAKTMVIPVALSLICYIIISMNNPISHVDEQIAYSIKNSFELNWMAAIPAVIMIVLPLVKVKVKWAVLASAVSAFIVTVACQHTGFVDALRYAFLGYDGSGEIGRIFSGGGMVSMLEVCGIILISCSYSIIIEETEMFHGLQVILKKGCRKFGRVTMTFLSGLGFSAVFCNQSVATIMCAIMLQQPYKDEGGDEQELAIDIENTTIITTAWIPWSIFMAVPRQMLSAPLSCIFYAVFIFLMPLCHMATKKYIWPRIYTKQ